MNDSRTWSRVSLLLAVAFGVAPASAATSEPGDPSPTSPTSLSPAPANTQPLRSNEIGFERSSRLLSPEWFLEESNSPAPRGAEANPARSTLGNARLDSLSPSMLAAAARTPQEPTIPNHPALSDRFFFGVGAFLATGTTTARLDSPSGVGTSIDFEDVLGLNETEWSPQGLGRWRFADRWRVELEYFEVDRSHTNTLNQDINWGNQFFPAGTQVKTKFDVSVTRLSCGYSFFKRPDKELGVALGFHLTDFDARLTGPGGNSESGKVLAPLPVLSMYGQVALTNRWALGGRIDAFKLEYDPYQGHIYSLGLDALYQPFRHVGFGLGWRGLEFEVEATKNNWDGRITSSFSGPIAFMSVSF